MKWNRTECMEEKGPEPCFFLVVHEWCNWFQKRCLPFVQLLIAMHCPSAVHGAYFDQHAHLHLSNVFCASVPAMIPYVYTDPWPWTLLARKWRWQLHTYNMQICPRAYVPDLPSHLCSRSSFAPMFHAHLNRDCEEPLSWHLPWICLNLPWIWSSSPTASVAGQCRPAPYHTLNMKKNCEKV